MRGSEETLRYEEVEAAIMSFFLFGVKPCEAAIGGV
jgi:hypothetical protein